MQTKSEKIELLNQLNETELKDLNCLEQWTAPTPLDNATDAPKFPLQCLPSPVCEYVSAIAENTATSVDMSAVAALSVVAGTVQGKYQIRGSSDYYEPLNLYTVIIAKPAERKSAVVRHLTKPIHLYEKAENDKRQAEIDRQIIELNSKNKKVKQLEEKGNIDEAVILKAECRELEKVQIKPLRLYADDVTPEALTSLLADNNGRLSIISAEGGLFETLAGRYSNAVSIDTVLKAHNGDTIRVDRKGRPSEYIPNPTLTMLLAAQENVLEGLMTNNIFRGRGLCGRFLYCQPTSTLGTRKLNNPPIPKQAEADFKELIFELLNIPAPTDEQLPKTIILSDEAYLQFEKFFDWLEPQHINELEYMGDWSGKFAGATLRIAGILHCMNTANLTFNETVSSETMKNAIKIAIFFLEHSKRAYQLMGIDEQLQQAKYVLKQLSKQTEKEMKRHSIFRICRSAKIQKADDIEPILNLLVEFNYLKELPAQPREGAGRKPDTVYMLNPQFFNVK